MAFGLVLATGASFGTTARAEADRASALLFNTVCTRCHEGECSGRLSFDSGPRVAALHIRRYAGEIDEFTVDALFDAVRFTKEDCGYYPLPPWPAGGPLASYRVPAGTGYFIPLGQLAAGSHRLLLSARGTEEVRVEIMRTDFELIYDESFLPDQGIAATLSLDREAGVFLRVTSRRPLELTGLQIED